MKGVDDFLGCRTILVRQRDQERFPGWIESLSQDACQIQMISEGCELRDVFSVTAYGIKRNLVFVGVCSRLEAPLSEEDGSSPPTGPLITLSWTGQASYKDPTQDRRRKTVPTRVILIIGETEIQATGLDISPNGIGILIDQELAPGQTLTVLLPHDRGEIRAKAAVRHSRAEGAGFRAGLELEHGNRIDQVLWRMYVESYASA